MAAVAVRLQTGGVSNPSPSERGHADEPEVGGPGISALPGGARLSVAAVAKRLGVAPATLRTWDRRYGLGPSEHSSGAHRRYTPEDVARLEAVVRLLQLGASPSEAARAALELDLTAPEVMAPDIHDEALGRPGGGTVVAIPGGTPSARGLARAAMALDAPGCQRIITDSLERRGVIATWDRLLAPVLVGIGLKWEASGSGVEVEHMLTETTVAAMQSVVASLSHPVNQRSVLLACAPDDLHSLPLFTVAAALAERRVSTRVLGARVPHESLLAAAKRTGPGAILVWSQRAETGGLGRLPELLDARPAPVVLLGGPGWEDASATGLTHVYDLTEAVTKVTAATCV